MFKKQLINSFFKKSFKVLFIRSIGVLLSFLTLLIITNCFSEDIAGQYNYLNSIVLLLSSIALLGMNDSFFQFIGKFEAMNAFFLIKQLYKKMVFILFIMCCGIWGGYFLFLRVFEEFIKENKLENVLLKSMILLFFYSFNQLNFQVIRGLKKLFLSEILRNIFRFATLLLLIGIIIFFNKKEYLLNVYILSFSLLSLVSFVIIVFNIKKVVCVNFELKNKVIRLKDIIKTSFPMTISYMSLLIMQSIDLIILKMYFEYDIIAYYGVVIRISMLTGIVLMSINIIIAPEISKMYYSNQKKELKALLNKSILLNTVFTVPLILFLLCFPSLVLSFFGENYIKANLVLVIICLGQLVNALSGSVGVYLNMTGRQKMFQRIVIITLLINLILNFLLIPKYGMIGAALSTSVSLGLWNIMGLIFIYINDKLLLFFTPNVLKKLK